MEIELETFIKHITNAQTDCLRAYLHPAQMRISVIYGYTHYFVPLSVFLQCHLNNEYCHVESFPIDIYRFPVIRSQHKSRYHSAVFVHYACHFWGGQANGVHFWYLQSYTPFVCNLNQCFKLHNIPIHRYLIGILCLWLFVPLILNYYPYQMIILSIIPNSLNISLVNNLVHIFCGSLSVTYCELIKQCIIAYKILLRFKYSCANTFA